MEQFPISTVLRRRILRTLTSVVLMMVLALGITPTGVSAASSWAPTLLVNTEAFQAIDAGNGSSDIELRFGASTKTLKFLFTKQVFQFSHGISVLGTISGSSLNVDRNATIGGSLTVTGAILGLNNITAKGILSGSTLRVSGPADVHGPLAVSGSIRSDGDITINDDLGAVNAVLTFGNNSTTHTLTFLNTKQIFQFSKGLSVLGTISGSSLNIDRNATVGGSLTVTGAIISKSTISGASLIVSGASSFSGTALFKTNTTVKGILSGATLRVSGGGADIQGLLSASGAIRTATGIYISVKNPAADAILSFGNTSGAQTLKFLNVKQIFQFTKGISVLGTISGSSLNIDRNATVGGTLTVTGAILGVSSITAKTTLSGNTLVVSNSAKVGGTLSASGTVALEGHLTGATIAGFGLSSCNGGGQILQWNSSTNKFECGTAASVGNGSGGILSLHPEYPNAIFFGSGTALQTVGQLSASGSVSLNENFYHWQTTQAGIQDYWISVRVRVPNNFSTWDPVKPIELRYRTADGTASNNHVSMRIRDTGGTERALTGAAGIASASFATANITGPESAGTWTPKGYFTVYIKLAALTGKFAEVGYINFNFESTTP